MASPVAGGSSGSCPTLGPGRAPGTNSKIKKVLILVWWDDGSMEFRPACAGGSRRFARCWPRRWPMIPWFGGTSRPRVQLWRLSPIVRWLVPSRRRPSSSSLISNGSAGWPATSCWPSNDLCCRGVPSRSSTREGSWGLPCGCLRGWSGNRRCLVPATSWGSSWGTRFYWRVRSASSRHGKGRPSGGFYLADLGLLPGFQASRGPGFQASRSGLASRLMRHCMAELEGPMWAESANPRGLDFYRRLGFAAVHQASLFDTTLSRLRLER
ncbi:hypothetical protein FM114_06050 [Luteococcus japonicus LSP_Lj1]|uniref:Uncharacterized protein n=1 Tax=Luteococcus japonicus LSP_Lj1 TaxID=1255658 RepID=A0A1R4J828_9ACTN|nr:hypothetical protein FM114_06050 [Luteococcus japonicus LSP_Lj1]